MSDSNRKLALKFFLFAAEVNEVIGCPARGCKCDKCKLAADAKLVMSELSHLYTTRTIEESEELSNCTFGEA